MFPKEYCLLCGKVWAAIIYAHNWIACGDVARAGYVMGKTMNSTNYYVEKLLLLNPLFSHESIFDYSQHIAFVK